MTRDKRGKANSRDDDLLLKEIRNRISSGGPWPARFQRLAQAILKAAGESGPEDITCDECAEAMELYAADELRGIDASRSYPAVARHLQRCPACREKKEALLEMLSFEPREQLAPVTPRLSFLRPKPQPSPWTTNVRAKERGKPLSVIFNFNPVYLQNLLCPSATAWAATRADRGLSDRETILLLSEIVTIGSAQWVVKLMATRSLEEPDMLHICATLAGSEGLPAGLQVRLTWGRYKIPAFINRDGVAFFAPVPLAELQEAERSGELSIEFVEDADDDDSQQP